MDEKDEAITRNEHLRAVIDAWRAWAIGHIEALGFAEPLTFDTVADTGHALARLGSLLDMLKDAKDEPDYGAAVALAKRGDPTEIHAALGYARWQGQFQTFRAAILSLSRPRTKGTPC